MDGKVCLVTGALGAIGLPICEALAREGATLVIHARDDARAKAAVESLKAKTGNAKIDWLTADFTSLGSVRKLAEAFKAKYSTLHVLVDNAAVFAANRRTTADGNEEMFGVNHLAPFLLTNLLLDTLKASAPSRIVVLTMDNTGPLKVEDPNSEQGFDKLKALFHAKACQGAMVRELAKKLQGTGVTVNAVNPEMTKTTLIREGPFWLRAAFGLLGQSPAKAAAGPLMLATSPTFEKVSGKFYRKTVEKPFPPALMDDAANAKVWATSVKLAGLSA